MSGAGKAWTGLLALTALYACAAEPVVGRPATGIGGAAAGSGGGGAIVSERCTPGTQLCFCPDGSMNGTQVCDARRELGTCQCASAPASVEQGMMSTTQGVCPQLAGNSTCAAQTYVSPQLPASVLFVIDRSGSMTCNAPPVQTVESCNLDPKRLDPKQPSRWEITTAALDATFMSLTGSASAIGLSLFSTDGFCGVDSTPVVGVNPVDMTQLTALSAGLHKSQPAGGTPIVGSVISAYHHLHEELRAVGNRYVVLITDGEESCGTLGNADNKADLLAARMRLLDTEVKKARDANIRTFVVGTPGSEGARGFLSELAFRGGTARSATCVHGDSAAAVGDCHYDLTAEKDFAAVLRSTLGRISGEARGCEFKSPSNNGSMLNVQVSKQGVAPVCLPMGVGDCSTANGFQFAKRSDGALDYSRVVLCGPACEMVKQDPTTVVDVILGCDIIF
ncbi:MAG: hypothetical protein RL701_5183 [Pseudomonadota bacterium]|jgi:hypothetical protein